MFNAASRRPPRRVRAAVLLLPWCAAAALAAPAGQTTRPVDRFTEIYNHSLLKQKAVHSIQARFTETTTSSLLVKPIVAHGIVIAAGPARVRMTYTDPDRKTLTMDGKTLAVLWPDRQERHQIDVTDIQKRVDQYFTKASVDDLRSMFEITVFPELSRAHTDRIAMRSKRKQIKAGLEGLELWIDRETDMLTQIRLVFPGGDEKTIRLEDIVFNVPISDDLFKG